MWIARLKIKHDCIIGNRCKRFQVTTTGTPFNVFVQNQITYSPQLHIVEGEEKDIRAFIADLKKDRKVSNLEVEGNTIFLIEVQKQKKVMASVYSQLSPKIIFVKPVVVDTQGYEYWEVTSWKKEILTRFITGIQKEVSKDVHIEQIKETKLTDIYYSRLLPKLTLLQKKAITSAFEEGYYEWPKRTNLIKLSRMMKISVPTFREHLKRAEKRLMPGLIKSLK